MKQEELVELIENIICDHGVPKSIKTTLEESVSYIGGTCTQEDKIAHLISVLDDVSSNPNLSMNARTHIWNIVSTLEGEMCNR